MTIAQNLMQQIDNAGLIFNVREESLYLESGLEIQDKKVIVNGRTGQPMGVVGNNYKVVTNEHVFDGFTKSIEASGINADGATINVKNAPNFARTMVQFRFPNEIISVNGDASQTQLQITALNSYDGSTRYITKAGGFRVQCLNGQILGKVVGSYSATHSKNLDVDEGAAQVMRMVQEFQSAKEYWSQLMERPVSSQTAGRVLEHLLEIRDTSPDALIKNARYQKALGIWSEYGREMGRNAYALYNTCTHWVTHSKPRNEESRMTNALTLQNRMTKVLDTESIFL